jgi:hypothetical protein
MVVVTVPLVREKVTRWRAWIGECLGPRRSEFNEFNRRMGLTSHHVWLSDGPHGPTAVVFHGGPGARTFLQKLGASDHPFDNWFRDRVCEYHGIDFSRIIETKSPELIMKWQAPQPAEVPA